MSEQSVSDRPGGPIEQMPAAPEVTQETRDVDAPTWSAPTEGHPMPPVAPAEHISGDTIVVSQAGAQHIEGRHITVSQGGAMTIRGAQVDVQQGGAFVIAGDRVDVREGGAFLILARHASGNVVALLDWRGIAALLAGLVALAVVRGRR